MATLLQLVPVPLGANERRLELSPVTPFWDEVEKNYRPEKERLQGQNYYDDLRLAKLKRCM